MILQESRYTGMWNSTSYFLTLLLQSECAQFTQVLACAFQDSFVRGAIVVSIRQDNNRFKRLKDPSML